MDASTHTTKSVPVQQESKVKALTAPECLRQLLEHLESLDTGRLRIEISVLTLPPTRGKPVGAPRVMLDYDHPIGSAHATIVPSMVLQA